MHVTIGADREYFRTPLLTERDFNDQWDSDEYRSNGRLKPHIQLHLAGSQVERISIVYLTDYEDEVEPPPLDTITLFTTRLDYGHADHIGKPVPPARCGPHHIIRAFGGCDGRARIDFIPEVYDFRHGIHEGARNIWNEYCLFTGNASIGRKEFCR